MIKSSAIIFYQAEKQKISLIYFYYYNSILHEVEIDSI